MDSGIVANWSKAPPPVPWVVIAITFFCLLGMTVYMFLSPLLQQAMIDLGGAVPSDTARMLSQSPGKWIDSGLLALFTTLFVHASWLHLLGNLAYLWVFGVKVEQTIGSFFMVIVFVLGGALAHLIVALKLPMLNTPVIGASGAVSAVVGAYLVLFPSKIIGHRVMVHAAVGLFCFWPHYRGSSMVDTSGRLCTGINFRHAGPCVGSVKVLRTRKA
jgi:membrane associated rhomboid family serine protease